MVMTLWALKQTKYFIPTPVQSILFTSSLFIGIDSRKPRLSTSVSCTHWSVKHVPKMEDSTPRVLSIQSHVVYGYVGNKSATFPLQVLGFEVDAINSVQFSNQPRYGYWKGQVLTEKEIDELMDGLTHNDLHTYTHLLTGYACTESFLRRIPDIVKQLRSKNQDLVYLCDPVMGDDGEMYVPPNLLKIYRDSIIPIADIITPNQFEVELLTGQAIKNAHDAWKAIDLLHTKGVPTVVMSSSQLATENSLVCFGSTVVGEKQSGFTIEIPKLPATFIGTGDLFSALFLGWMWHSKNNLKESLENSIATMQAVLNRTYQHLKGKGEKASVADHELKLIQSKLAIEKPEVVVRAIPR